jgi:DNA-binding MarR family transcriptional regulator
MDIERPNLVIIIDELEERELITRERVPTDRRSYALHPTQSGRVLYRVTLDAVTQHESKLLSQIPPEQLEQMIATLKLIEAAKERQV